MTASASGAAHDAGDLRSVPERWCFEDMDQAEAQAQQIKLAALGRLSASIAHEIRNPLSAIKQAAQLIGEEMAERPEAQALTTMIDKNVDRIDRIVRDVSPARAPRRGTPVAIELETAVTELIDDLSATCPHLETLFRIATQGQATIHADRGHFEEMLVNPGVQRLAALGRVENSVTITVTVEDDMQRAVITVTMTATAFPQTFGPHLRAVLQRQRQHSARALHLVRELALANGGSVRLGSPKREPALCPNYPLMPIH